MGGDIDALSSHEIIFLNFLFIYLIFKEEGWGDWIYNAMVRSFPGMYKLMQKEEGDGFLEEAE